MNKNNKNIIPNSIDKKLHIYDASCIVCGFEIKHTQGHSFIWNGIYYIQRCDCGTKVVKKHYN